MNSNINSMNPYSNVGFARSFASSIVSISVAHFLFWLFNLTCLVYTMVVYPAIPLLYIGSMVLSFVEIIDIILLFVLSCSLQPSHNPIQFFRSLRPWTSYMKKLRIISCFLAIFRVLHSAYTCYIAIVVMVVTYYNYAYYYNGYNYYYIPSDYQVAAVATAFLIFFFDFILMIINSVECVTLGNIRMYTLQLDAPGCCGCGAVGCCGPDLCKDDMAQGCCDCTEIVPNKHFNGDQPEIKTVNMSANSIFQMPSQQQNPAGFVSPLASQPPVSMDIPVAETVKVVEPPKVSLMQSNGTRDRLIRYYNQVDPDRLKDIDSMVVQFDKMGLEEYNSIVRPVYGYGVDEVQVAIV